MLAGKSCPPKETYAGDNKLELTRGNVFTLERNSEKLLGFSLSLQKYTIKLTLTFHVVHV